MKLNQIYIKVMTEQQIQQIMGQLEKSCDMFEKTEASEVEYQEYCDNIYSAVAYWRNQLRQIRLKNKES
tara:strand:+ start:264 stop:470 length:207 start_codon:yes stop_codon:yes gene_type:complete